ncbi:hypothetical protein OC861_006181 [Tilletia horrida]|nr:hypothetical protein OC861_006181 [Tilletia horrida]
MSDPVAAAIATAGVPADEPSNAHSVPLSHHDEDDEGEDDLVVYADEHPVSNNKAKPAAIPTFSLTRASMDGSKSGRSGQPQQGSGSNSVSVLRSVHGDPSGSFDPEHDEDDDEEDGLNFDYRSHLLPLSPSAEDDDDDYEARGAVGASSSSRGAGGSRGRGRAVAGAQAGSSHNGAYGEVEGSIRAGLLNGSSRTSRSRSTAGTKKAMREHSKRVGLIDGIALTVGLQIGSGIFSSPGVVTLNAGSVGASFLVWILSGILAWTGASSFAELGAAIPLNGGAQAYLNYSFGPLSAYLFAWTAITALKPGSGAIIAIIFGEYVARIIFHVYVPLRASDSKSENTSDPLGGVTTSFSANNTSAAALAKRAPAHEQGLESVPDWAIKLIACGLVALLTLFNVISAKLGTRLQVATVVVKLLALVTIPIFAIVQVSRGRAPEASLHAYSSLGALFEGSATSASAYALACYTALWSFDGFDTVSYVAASFKNPSRDLPRAIHTSLSIVLVVFVAAVASYFAVLPPAQVKRTNTVALDFGSALFGNTGAILFASLVAFSCFGALNGSIYTSGRLVSAASAEGYLPSVFAVYSRRTDTPVAAILLQSGLTILFVLFGSGFASLVNFYAVCSWSFYCLTGLALLSLRVKEPNLERPYKTWLATPILFSTLALFLLFMPIFSAPLEALAAAGFIGAGVPMYFITQPKARARIPGLRWLHERLGFGRRTSMGLDGVGVGGAAYANLVGALPGDVEDSDTGRPHAMKEARGHEHEEEEEAMEMLPKELRESEDEER